MALSKDDVERRLGRKNCLSLALMFNLKRRHLWCEKITYWVKKEMGRRVQTQFTGSLTHQQLFCEMPSFAEGQPETEVTASTAVILGLINSIKQCKGAMKTTH